MVKRAMRTSGWTFIAMHHRRQVQHGLSMVGLHKHLSNVRSGVEIGGTSCVGRASVQVWIDYQGHPRSIERNSKVMIPSQNMDSKRWPTAQTIDPHQAAAVQLRDKCCRQREGQRGILDHGLSKRLCKDSLQAAAVVVSTAMQHGMSAQHISQQPHLGGAVGFVDHGSELQGIGVVPQSDLGRYHRGSRA